MTNDVGTNQVVIPPLRHPLLLTRISDIFIVYVLSAIIANAVLYGGVYLESKIKFLPREPAAIDPPTLIIAFVVVPAAGILYGIVSSLWYFTLAPQRMARLHPTIHIFVNPVLQAFFQPIWFMAMVLVGVTLVGLFELLSGQ